MPKSTPSPTNSTANATDSRLNEPTMARPNAVVIDRPIKQVDEDGGDDPGRMQCHPEDHEHHQHGADAVPDRAVLHGGEFLVGHRHRSGQADAGVILAGQIELGGGLPDRIAWLLAGLERVEIEDRLELDERALVAFGQRRVADELAPGEGRRAVFQDVLDGARDLVERPRGILELDLSALDAGDPGFQRAGQPPGYWDRPP